MAEIECRRMGFTISIRGGQMTITGGDWDGAHAPVVLDLSVLGEFIKTVHMMEECARSMEGSNGIEPLNADGCS